MSDPCPFCSPPADRLFFSGELAFGLWDGFPVSRGHALVIPRRHFASWFDATPQEHQALVEGVAAAREEIGKQFSPDGYNVGINVGAAAGQTVFHLHVHVIPRYAGDVPNPRGGVRHVIPHKADYRVVPATVLEQVSRVPHQRPLVRGEDDPLLPHLVADVDRACAADIAVAFVRSSGVVLVEEHLRDLLNRRGRIRFLTGDYLGVTEPEALLQLLDLDGNLRLRVFESQKVSFHPKVFILHFTDGSGTAYIGSSNLTNSALRGGVEWNYRILTTADKSGFRDITNAFEMLFRHPRTRPVDERWIASYARRRVPEHGAEVAIELEPTEAPPEPHGVQQEALAALELTRNDGNSSGLVVLATGLGKTWLAAFDSNRPEFRRILFVAHREEILAQAKKTFRRIRPKASQGRYEGGKHDDEVGIVFASIMTLGQMRHLDRFASDHFDYIVVDEFHHAAARTYRNLIDHFRPKFLLGLTATPERADGGDLLTLCQENLVYRCDVFDGIQRGLLSPFKYFGVPDEVDYSNIPWRNSRFDEEALTAAVATQKRAENAFQQFKRLAQKQTLAFCCSQRHADFMSQFFVDRGVRSVAVHSGATSAPRSAALEQLQQGNLDVVFAVDMFNEGVDVPNIDTVLMLRPTESIVVWQQQFGRGLRKSEGKTQLNVIDYIGNHRSFLTKVRALLRLSPGDQQIDRALNLLLKSEFELPPGCEVTYELDVVDIIKSLLRPGTTADAIKNYYRDFKERNGARPTAVEAFHDEYSPKSLRAQYGSWLEFVKAMGDLSPDQEQVLLAQRDFLAELEVTQMTKSFKMLTLLAMVNADRFPGTIDIQQLVTGFRDLAQRSAALRLNVGPALGDADRLRELIETNPVRAWCGGRGTRGRKYFRYGQGMFESTMSVKPEHRNILQEFVREIADWRLAEYLARPGAAAPTGRQFICKVIHSGGNPILKLPERSKVTYIPHGWTTVLTDEGELEANFAKIAVNVVRRPNSEANVLTALLRKWFGSEAGLPGTRFCVTFAEEGGHWRFGPVRYQKKNHQ